MKVTLALEQLAVWMKHQEGINVTVNDRLNDIERKTDLIMKATRFSPSSASLK
jgi:phenylalanyl-tRNA synthetase beta subunit